MYYLELKAIGKCHADLAKFGVGEKDSGFYSLSSQSTISFSGEFGEIFGEIVDRIRGNSLK